jgi:hypothetical protein
MPHSATARGRDVRAKREILEQAAIDYAASKRAKPGSPPLLDAASELERAVMAFAKAVDP